MMGLWKRKFIGVNMVILASIVAYNLTFWIMPQPARLDNLNVDVLRLWMNLFLIGLWMFWLLSPRLNSNGFSYRDQSYLNRGSLTAGVIGLISGLLAVNFYTGSEVLRLWLGLGCAALGFLVFWLSSSVIAIDGPDIEKILHQEVSRD